MPSKLFSQYQSYSRDQWQQFCLDHTISFDVATLSKLSGQNDPVTATEVTQVYLPISELLSIYAESARRLQHKQNQFLCTTSKSSPFIIGIAGSVGVGKSTTARVLQAILSTWPGLPKVDIITTDSFLYNNAELERRGLMQRKGFPESYNLKALVSSLETLKNGATTIEVPVYSHHHYDIVQSEIQIIQQPDIVIVEGLSVMQIGPSRAQEKSRVYVSELIDFTIYVDAQTDVIKQWFLDRFRFFREKAKTDRQAFFYQFAQMPENQALSIAIEVWHDINEKNLNQNILPYREHANLILHKSNDHAVDTIYLRRV